MSDDSTGGERSGYFFTSPDAQIDPSADPRYMVVERDVLALHPIKESPGLTLRPVFGQNLTMSFVYMEPHSVAPVHQHAEEQVGTIIEGEYEFDLNGDKRVVRKGDVYVVPPWVPHGAVTHDTSVIALDVFSPPRAGFAELMEEALREAGRRLDPSDHGSLPPALWPRRSRDRFWRAIARSKILQVDEPQTERPEDRRAGRAFDPRLIRLAAARVAGDARVDPARPRDQRGADHDRDHARHRHLPRLRGRTAGEGASAAGPRAGAGGRARRMHRRCRAARCPAPRCGSWAVSGCGWCAPRSGWARAGQAASARVSCRPCSSTASRRWMPTSASSSRRSSWRRSPPSA